MENNDSFGAAFGRLVKRKRAESTPKMTQGDLAAALFPNDANARHTRKGDISKLETGKTPNPQTRTVQAIAEILGISEEEIDALRKQAQMTPAEKLDNVDKLDRFQLEFLAGRFEIERAFDLKDQQLLEVLAAKAEEYRDYRERVEAIDDRVAALGNIKAAARDAADNLDFDEVEDLLSHVDLTETEIAAETKVLRARNALMRGRSKDAFTILNAAADSFASVDPQLPVRYRLQYEDILYAHGRRYGGNGLALAIDMIRAALDQVSEADNAELWASAQNSLGNALSEQGSRTGGADGADLLAQAVTAYRAALRVCTEDQHPVNWAATQNNLGNALRQQSIRTDGADLLAQAVTAYRAALQVYTEDQHPVHWAATQNNLGTALQEQGGRTGGAEGADLLAQAVTAYRDALRVRTEDQHPVHWAGTQNNLGVALSNQGSLTGGAERNELLAKAVTAYRDALRVYTEDRHPVHWATTEFNLADLHLDKSTMSDTPRADLQQALGHVWSALRVYDPSMPQDHQDALDLRKKIQAALDALPPDSA